MLWFQYPLPTVPSRVEEINNDFDRKQNRCKNMKYSNEKSKTNIVVNLVNLEQ